MATRKLPKGATTRRPSSRAYASNRAVIDMLVAPEKTNINYPSTMSGSRDSQRKAFADNKTGASKNYKMVDGKMVEISEAEWNQAAKKFVKQEGTGRGTIKAGQTTANPSRMDVLKKAVAKVQGKKGVDTGLSAAERKMAREGIAPPRKPATPPTAAPATTTTPATATKMTRAERSAANKAKHAVVRAAEEKKWAEQKSAKTKTTAKPAATTAAPKTPAAAKPAAAKPAPKTATAKPATTAKPKPVATAKPKPAVTASKAPNLTAQGEARAAGVRERANAYRLNQSVRGAQARMAERAAASKQGFIARNFPNVTTVVREGLASKAGRTAALQAGKSIATGLLSRGNVALTALTYSPDAGAGSDKPTGRKYTGAGYQPLQRPAGAARQAPASAVSRGGSRPVQKPAAAPVSAPKKVATVRKTSAASAAPTPTANPQKAIADFEAKLRSAGAVSIAGGVGGKPSMISQASEMTAKQLEEKFKKVKGPR